jgi:cytochrome c-type biogenesis protein CcmH
MNAESHRHPEFTKDLGDGDRSDGRFSPTARRTNRTLRILRSFAHALRTTSLRKTGGVGVVLLLIATFSLSAAQEPLKVPDAAQFVGQPQGTPLAGAQLAKRTSEVAGMLRCPVCQGMSVADSPAEMAVNMKGQVHELLERGYTEAQILTYFERSYGQFVLLKPKFEGTTTLVWLLPLIALLIGAGVLVMTFRRLGRRPITGNQPPGSLEDDEYVARVRDLVSGGKN